MSERVFLDGWSRLCGKAITVFTVLLVGACSPGEEPEVINCVTSFDCPVGWFCEDNICVDTPDAVPSDRDQLNEAAFSENEGVAMGDEDSLPDVSTDGEDGDSFSEHDSDADI